MLLNIMSIAQKILKVNKILYVSVSIISIIKCFQYGGLSLHVSNTNELKSCTKRK